MPWDRGGPPADLLRYLAREPGQGRRVLIPGCGTAWEVAACHEAGYRTVAIDFSEAAVVMARAALGPLTDVVVLGDSFGFDFGAAFDLVYERAFLCSLPPRVWSRYAERLGQVLHVGGRLAGYFYCHDDGEDGPPFPLTTAGPRQLLGEGFTCLEDTDVEDSVPVFSGHERWQVWERTV